VSARALLALFDSIYVVALTAWIGSILFFSFGVTPIGFRVLGAEAGARFVRALLPRYYLWGVISGSIALPAFAAGPLCYPEYRGARVGVQAMAILACTLIMLYAGNTLVPAIDRARDAGPSGDERFQCLHRRSVLLNSVVLVVGLALLIAFAIRAAPESRGIVELSPLERARYDAAVSRIIEDVETKYGLRPPRPRHAGESTEPETVLDKETVKEIESYYAPWRARPKEPGRTGMSSSAAPSTRPAQGK
jgi:hypothetical protein